MRDGGAAPAVPRPGPAGEQIAPYEISVRPVIWTAAQPFHSRRISGLVEITSANSAIAASLHASLLAERYQVEITDHPSGTAEAVFLTEGLSDSDMTSRHWAALATARLAKRQDATIILLQWATGSTGLEGLARTLRAEWPGMSLACWTLPQSSACDLTELTAWLGGNSEDLWFEPGGGALRCQTGDLLSPLPIPPRSESDVWLVTGGARGVTAACVTDLARQTGGTFILAGRSAQTPWPDGIAETDDLTVLRGRIAASAKQHGEKHTPAAIDKAARAAIAGLEIRETLSTIQASGARAIYTSMDTSDPASVNSALARISEQFGPITGLIHGAGIIADRLADEKTESEFRSVFAPKAEGLFHLLENIDQSALRHVALFSSASAFIGNRGQCDYAMANAILTNTGRSLAANLPDSRIKVFDWGPWEGGMVDAALARHFREQGVSLISFKEGARIFTHELLAGDPDQVELVIGSMERDV